MYKKSISNIAWPQEDEDWVLKELQRRKWNAVEAAPGRLWPDFTQVKYMERRRYLEKLNAYGLKVCSLHSLFYGIKDADIFGGLERRKIFQDYMGRLIELAADLEAAVLILGSPVVRDRKGLSISRALDIASAVLRKPAEEARKSGVRILIEPLSGQETNFINSHIEALLLVDAVDSGGFGLHLDAKSIAAEDTPVQNIIYACAGKTGHFHINDPALAEIGESADYHKEIAGALKKTGYSNYVSIEMRQTDTYRRSITKSLDYVDTCY